MVETILIVSPHLDDAVLSVGGSIATWRAVGHRVIVASVYTKGPPLAELAPSMRKFADYAARGAEDDAACEVLGAETRRLGQFERAFRKPYLKGWSFFSTPKTRAGFDRLDIVTRAIDEQLALAPDRILVPFGIGNHVDHVEATIATTDAAIARGWLSRLWFYEDLYALSGRMRRRHFVAKTRIWRSWQAPLLRAGRLAVVLQTIAAARRGPGIETLLDDHLRDATWRVERSEIDEDRKLAAIACYASQTRAFGGLAGISRALRAYHALWDGAEPLWRAS